MIILLGISCKSTKTINSGNTNNTTTNVDENNYRFVVSFISIGQGIDSKLNEDFIKLLTDSENKTKKKINAENYQKGREGEIQYCMKLKNFNEKEQENFIKEVKALFGGSTMVILNENCTCTNKK
jgi:hypothetical protein